MTPEQTVDAVQKLIDDGMHDLRAHKAAMAWNAGKRIARNQVDNIAFVAFKRVEDQND